MLYSVVMPCAGIGSRMQLGYNKLLFKMKNGKTVLENTMAVFLKDERCREMILAVGENDLETIQTLIHDDRIKLVIGGATRQESVYHGLQRVTLDYVLIHDGARPFLTQEKINDLLTCLEKRNACLLMVPAKDTIKVVKDGKVISTPDRSTLYQAQTPQAFKTSLVKAAFEKAENCHFIGTDDASVVEAMSEENVYMVLGDYANIKITTKDDLKYADF